MADQTVFIYGLFDPREPDLIRYVGKTSRTVQYRRWEHQRAAKKGEKWPVSCWIRKLAAADVSPAFSILEIVAPGDDWAAAESAWIGRMRALPTGKTLLNATDGGDGASGAKRSPETLEKLRDIARRRGNNGVSPNKGKTLSSEHRAALSLAHKGQVRPWTDEQRKKASESARLRPPLSDAKREVLRRAQLDSSYSATAEHRARLSEAAKAAWARKKQEVAHG